MRASQQCKSGLGVVCIVLVLGFATMPAAAWADPGDTVPAEPAPVPAAQPVEPVVPVDPAEAADPTGGVGDSPAVVACSQFADALDGASVFYGDFADAIEGTVRPDYADPSVSTTNTSGRTALRESASKAIAAAGTPGLQSDVANPMRSWSFDATKLLLKMGLHGGGQTLNATASELNEDASSAQMACAGAGTHA